MISPGSTGCDVTAARDDVTDGVSLVSPWRADRTREMSVLCVAGS